LLWFYGDDNYSDAGGYAKPLRTGGVRKLGNMAVVVTKEEMKAFLNAWHLMRSPLPGAA
jgi:hypothetical protein